jgi:hypothetical protein
MITFYHTIPRIPLIWAQVSFFPVNAVNSIDPSFGLVSLSDMTNSSIFYFESWCFFDLEPMGSVPIRIFEYGFYTIKDLSVVVSVGVGVYHK